MTDNLSPQMSICEFRDEIERRYRDTPTGCGGGFGEILCWEIHENGQTFLWLAEKWDISVSFLGELIADHCIKLEPLEDEPECPDEREFSKEELDAGLEW